MWKIVFTVDRQYRDDDNYYAESEGDIEIVEGEDIEDAIHAIYESLKLHRTLNDVIDSRALNLSSYDTYYEVNIHSIDEIKKSIPPFDILENSALFKDLVEERIKKNKIKNKLIEEKEKEIIKQTELVELERLRKNMTDTSKNKIWFDIEIEYETGNSFNTETRFEMLCNPVSTIDMAIDNLKRIQKHYKECADNPNFGKHYSLVLLTDHGERTISPFWIGYFEKLHNAKIVIDMTDNKDLSFDMYS